MKQYGPWVFTFILCALIGLSPAAAQEFEPRSYAVAPVGLNFFSIGYGFLTGAVFMDPSLPVEDVDSEVHVVIASYVRTLEMFGRPTKLKLVQPWSNGHWDGFLEGEFRTRDTAGLVDTRVVVETIFAGAEAMTAAEMADYQPKTVWGARLQLIAPTGSYDNDKVINLGANRWGLIPEIGFGTPVGKWSFEGTLGAWLFGDNDEFVGEQLLEQEPLIVSKLHAIYTVRPGYWWALAAGFGYGGRTTVDGVKRDTVQRNTRFAMAMAYPIRANQGVSVLVGSGANRGAGTRYYSVALGYQYAW